MRSPTGTKPTIGIKPHFVRVSPGCGGQVILRSAWGENGSTDCWKRLVLFLVSMFHVLPLLLFVSSCFHLGSEDTKPVQPAVLYWCLRQVAVSLVMNTSVVNRTVW